MRIPLRVVPKSNANSIDGFIEAQDGLRLKIRITAAPEGGRANKAVIALLAKNWKVSKSSLAITAGSLHRDKIIEARGDAGKIEAWFKDRGWSWTPKATS